MKKIQPKLASGFRDYLPEDMIAKQKMLDTIRHVFERFGFAPLETPVIEREEILTGGDENFNKEIFRIASRKEDKESSGLAMRFDLTVPLARVVASNPEIGRPFKRYQIGLNYRAEHAQFGRFREFMQCDADIVGSDSPLSDAEIIFLVWETLNALGISKFKIKINSRKFLNLIMERSGIDGAKYAEVLKIIDKLDKIGWSGVEEEISKVIEKDKFETLKKFIESDEKDRFAEFIDLEKNLSSLGMPGSAWVLEPSLARGQSYYTGIIFETYLDDIETIGSIFSGGRYDDLIAKFSKDKMPAVGASIGVDRLFVALDKLGLLKKSNLVADVLILNFEKEAEGAIQKIASALRGEGINTEIYLGKEDSFKGQLAYAVKREYSVVIILGGKEMDSGKIVIKDMKKRDQIETSFEEAVLRIKELLNR